MDSISSLNISATIYESVRYHIRYLCVGYGQGLIFCKLLPGNEYKGTLMKRPDGFDSKLVRPDTSSGRIRQKHGKITRYFGYGSNYN